MQLIGQLELMAVAPLLRQGLKRHRQLALFDRQLGQAVGELVELDAKLAQAVIVGADASGQIGMSPPFFAELLLAQTQPLGLSFSIRRREPNRLGQLLALFRGLRDRRLEALPADSYLFELVAQLRQLLLRPLAPLSVRGSAHAHPRL